MKVVLIITDYGSFNNFLSELAVCTTDQNWIELHIICSKQKVIDIKDKRVFGNNIEFHFVDIPRKISLSGIIKAAIGIRGIINQIRPDLVHLHFTTAAFPALIARRADVPYWATFHGLGMNSSSGFKKLIFSFVEMFCFLRLDRIFTVNDEDTLLVKKYFKNKIKKYDCLGFGCDINKFCYQNISEKTRNQIKSNNDINGRIIITFTGRFVSFKGFHLVIKSFKTLCELYPGKFKLILMGGEDPIHGTGLNDDETIFFEKSEHIINVGFTNDVENYLAVTDIFLFPSKKEGLPTCILEALSMGVPVITFNARGNRDIIKDKYNGLLISPAINDHRDVENIVNAIESMTVKKSPEPHFKNNALKDRNKYSRGLFVDEQLRYYNELRQNSEN